MTAAPATRIDPRLRARRAAVQREIGRRRLWILLAVLSVVAAVSLGYAVLHSSLVDVDRIEIAGATHSGDEVVRETAGVDYGEPLLLLDTGAVARRIEELPWVVEARVERALPGGLTISVVEQPATAYVRRDSRFVLVGRDGTVLGEADAAEAGAVELVGLRRLPEVGALVSPRGVGGLSEGLPGDLARSVSAVDLGGDDVVLLLGAGGEVRLGELADIAAKGAAALAVLERLAGQPFAYIDVSVPSAPVVGPA